MEIHNLGRISASPAFNPSRFWASLNNMSAELARERISTRRAPHLPVVDRSRPIFD
jgi:hypothetical protein